MCQDYKLARLQVNKLVSLDPRPDGSVRGIRGVNEKNMTLDKLEVNELQLAQRQQFPGNDGPSIFEGSRS